MSSSISTTASTASARGSCARSRAARSSRTASSRSARAARAPPAPRGRSARGTASQSSSRAIESCPQRGSARSATSVSRTSAGCWSSTVPLSDDLRDELAAISPARRCCRAAELSALFHAAGSWHLRGRGEVAVHLDLAGSAVARRAFSLLRDLGVRSEIRTYPRRAFDRATRYQLHVRLDARAREVLREAGVVSRAGAPLERPPKRVV